MAEYAQVRERRVLDVLKERYENEGYTFFVYPPRELIPAFLGTYMPDAIAVSPQESIVFEIKGQRSAKGDMTLAELSKKFEGKKNWKLIVIYGDEVDKNDEEISLSSKMQIERHLNEAEKLLAHGHIRAAFVVAWGAFEAVARRILKSSEFSGLYRPKSPQQLSEMLERQGFLGFEGGRQLRSLASTRNAIVHGDLSKGVDKAKVTSLLNLARLLVSELP